MVEELGFGEVRDRDQVAFALKHLPQRERDIVRLRFSHDLTQAEIAKELGISQMHVSRLLRSALASLRAVMEDEESGQARVA